MICKLVEYNIASWLDDDSTLTINIVMMIIINKVGIAKS